jgi:hypothetical protein
VNKPEMIAFLINKCGFHSDIATEFINDQFADEIKFVKVKQHSTKTWLYMIVFRSYSKHDLVYRIFDTSNSDNRNLPVFDYITHTQRLG